MADSKHILIVDDEKFVSSILDSKLAEKGFTITSAKDGKEAIDLIDSQHFDLILLDILMPIKNGWDVLKHVKGTGIQVIVTSNLSQEEDKQKAKDLGAVEYLVKANVSASEIVDKVVALLA